MAAEDEVLQSDALADRRIWGVERRRSVAVIDRSPQPPARSLVG
jgi:hypothetical protein